MIDRIPIALTIAGSDSGGGAGVQADLKTFHAFSVYGTSVVTAVTAQNTVGVTAIHPVPIDVVVSQLDVVVDDLRPDALKSGMLATRELVEAAADGIERHGLAPYVLDPVMVATSGDRLLRRDAEDALRAILLPRATVVTPNLGEAEILLGETVRTEDEMVAAARALVDLGAGAALVKGGHLAGDVVDVLYDGGEIRSWRRPRIETRHTHGTGCTLSAAIAACLAGGRPVADAVEVAGRFVARAIGSAPGLGSGHGPVNHFAPVD